MITDKMIDETLVEILRTKRALEALRKARQASTDKRPGQEGSIGDWSYCDQRTEHAAAKRASLDLTRKLAQLRKGD